jgi:hypothetical protein
MRLVQDDGRPASSAEPQEHLIKLLCRARSWWEVMLSSGLSIADITRKYGVTSSYASRLIKLNFLAPDIVEAILAGTQPAALGAKALLNVNDLPLNWASQNDLLLAS